MSGSGRYWGEWPRRLNGRPGKFRVRKALTSFGPKGAWWLRDRVEGVVEVLTGHRIKSAEPQGDGVLLRLDGAKESSVTADHVIAGTGFRMDISRLPFMTEEILAGLATRANLPLVNRAGESSVPGLYFAGALTTVSLGPGVRFISGAHQTAAQLAKSVARRARKGAGTVAPATAPASRRPLATAGTGPHSVI